MIIIIIIIYYYLLIKLCFHSAKSSRPTLHKDRSRGPQHTSGLPSAPRGHRQGLAGVLHRYAVAACHWHQARWPCPCQFNNPTLTDPDGIPPSVHFRSFALPVVRMSSEMEVKDTQKFFRIWAPEICPEAAAPSQAARGKKYTKAKKKPKSPWRCCQKILSEDHCVE